MDFSAFTIGGMSVLILTLGIVEAAKRFGVTGRWSEALAIGLGATLVGLAQAIQKDLIPAVALPWIEIVVVGIGGGLAATGVYDLAKKLLKR